MTAVLLATVLIYVKNVVILRYGFHSWFCHLYNYLFISMFWTSVHFVKYIEKCRDKQSKQYGRD